MSKTYYVADVPGVGDCEIHEEDREQAMDALRDLFGDRRDWDEDAIELVEMAEE